MAKALYPTSVFVGCSARNKKGLFCLAPVQPCLAKPDCHCLYTQASLFAIRASESEADFNLSQCLLGWDFLQLGLSKLIKCNLTLNKRIRLSSWLLTNKILYFEFTAQLIPYWNLPLVSIDLNCSWTDAGHSSTEQLFLEETCLPLKEISMHYSWSTTSCVEGWTYLFQGPWHNPPQSLSRIILDTTLTRPKARIQHVLDYPNPWKKRILQVV